MVDPSVCDWSPNCQAQHAFKRHAFKRCRRLVKKCSLEVTLYRDEHGRVGLGLLEHAVRQQRVRLQHVPPVEPSLAPADVLHAANKVSAP